MTSGQSLALETSELPGNRAQTSNGTPFYTQRHGLASFYQERLWFLERLRPCGATFHARHSIRVRGTLDNRSLTRALEDVIRRHNSLRTTFCESNGVLQQNVTNETPRLQLDDLSAIGRAAAERRVEELSAIEFTRAFDLTNGPLLRSRLLRLSENEHILLFCVHRIIFDRLSWKILIRELGTLYGAYRSGRGESPRELSFQYLDFAMSQRSEVDNGADGDDLAYWKEHFAGAPALLELPSDHPRPALQSYRGAAVNAQLSPKLLIQAQDLASRKNTSVSAVLLASWNALLSKSCATEDIVVGVASAGRRANNLHETIGPFATTTLLRTALSGDPSFNELLTRVRDSLRSSEEHQQVPLEVLLTELQPERSLSHSPIFQVLFEVIEQDDQEAGIDGLQLSEIPVTKDSTIYDLHLVVSLHSGALAVELTYSSALFDHSTIERMLEHYSVLLGAALAESETRLSELPLMTAKERLDVLEIWNSTQTKYPSRFAIHRWFEKQVTKTPNHAAIVFEGERLSYRELNERANQLAWHLRHRGTTSEQLVGICLERSFDMVIAVLAVLKAGAAYVPLNPAYPKDRLKYVLDDSHASLVVTEQSLLERICTSAGKAVCLDTDAAKIREEPVDNGAAIVKPRQLSYVLYTSGSTGKPKGVQITHRNVTNFLSSMQQVPGITAQDTLLAVTTLSFDIAGLELFLPLVTGATIVLASRKEASDGRDLRTLIDQYQVTMLQATPATWSLLLDAGFTGSPKLKALCGGEALPRDLAKNLLDRCGEVWNMYGPTETTIWSSLFRVCERKSSIVPIGRPLANTKLYVLNEGREPVPVGLAGELYIGGHGVGRGYLNRPDLTRERFLSDPFTRNGMMYRTGDRVRWLADGNLEFLGRLDEQVKLRGFRIELGEVESEIAKHPGVTEARVVIREHQSCGKRLVAYIVGSAQPEHLRLHLRQTLPDYMVPAAFVQLDRLPLTSNGKLDRKALPEPELARVVARAEPPRNLIEGQLIAIWEELLGTADIGATQDFFEIGGHSLLAMRLFAEIKSQLNCDLPLSTLFTGPTVRSMADAIMEQKRSSSPVGRLTPVVPLQPNGSLPPLFCVHPAGRDVYPYLRLAHHLGADQPVYGIRDHGDELGRPLLQIAREHTEAIRAVQPNGPYYILGYSFGVLITYEMAVYLESQNESVAFLGILDMVEPARCTEDSGGDDITDLAILAFGQVQPQELIGMELEDQLRFVVDRLEARGAAPRGFDTSELRDQFQLVKARRQCIKDYIPGSYAGRVTLFRASEMRDIDQGFLSWMKDWTEEERETYGWCRRTPNRVDVCPVPGTHMSMLREPHVVLLADRMREALASARQGVSA
jgi:amino acid adenylation domain-containing protein